MKKAHLEIFFAKYCQLVLMSLKPKEEIGEEIHTGDQFFRLEAGTGRVIIDGNTHQVKSGDAIIVPAGAKHNVINDSEKEALKLYTIYAPPHHKDKTVHVTKADAEKDSEQFDGQTTE